MSHFVVAQYYTVPLTRNLLIHVGMIPQEFDYISIIIVFIKIHTLIDF